MKKQLIVISLLMIMPSMIFSMTAAQRQAALNRMGSATRTQQQTQGQGEASEGPASQTLEKQLAQDPKALVDAIGKAFGPGGSDNTALIGQAYTAITGQQAPTVPSQQLKSMGRLGRNK